MASPFVFCHVEVALEVSHAGPGSGRLRPHPDDGGRLLRESDEAIAATPYLLSFSNDLLVVERETEMANDLGHIGEDLEAAGRRRLLRGARVAHRRLRMMAAVCVSGIGVTLSGCANLFDKPWISYHESPDQKDRIQAWSSGSAAAVGMSNNPGDPFFCVLGASFARTGTVNSGASVSILDKSLGASTGGSAGALLIKNEGQTATYLDTGLFHLCMMYSQALIPASDRADLIKGLFTSSVEVAKSSSQFAVVAAQQPASDAASAASAAASSADAAASAAKTAANSASAAAGSASAAQPVAATAKATTLVTPAKDQFLKGGTSYTLTQRGGQHLFDIAPLAMGPTSDKPLAVASPPTAASVASTAASSSASQPRLTNRAAQDAARLQQSRQRND